MLPPPKWIAFFMSDILFVGICVEKELNLNVSCVRGSDIFLWQLEDKDKTKLSFEASYTMTIPVILESIRDRCCLLTFVQFLWVVVVICFCPTA
jgi:hypothetical protein